MTERIAEPPKEPASEEAQQLAAQAWCQEKTSGIEMDTVLCMAFARVIDTIYGNERIAELEARVAELRAALEAVVVISDRKHDAWDKAKEALSRPDDFSALNEAKAKVLVWAENLVLEGPECFTHERLAAILRRRAQLSGPRAPARGLKRRESRMLGLEKQWRSGMKNSVTSAAPNLKVTGAPPIEHGE